METQSDPLTYFEAAMLVVQFGTCTGYRLCDVPIAELRRLAKAYAEINKRGRFREAVDIVLKERDRG